MEDYIVRFGNDTATSRSEYMTEKQALAFYDKITLDTKTTWKELIHEPIDSPEVQKIIKSDTVKVIDLGICEIAVPEK